MCHHARKMVFSRKGLPKKLEKVINKFFVTLQLVWDYIQALVSPMSLSENVNNKILLKQNKVKHENTVKYRMKWALVVFGIHVL